jgi:hypothetical protein
MFFVILVVNLISAIIISYLYFIPTKNYLWVSKKLIINMLWILIFILTGLICSNLAKLGLVFNPHAPELDFSQTISAAYLGQIFFADFIYVGIGVSIYYLFTRNLKISPTWILVGFFFIMMFIYYPGLFVSDADGQYQQFLNHSYTTIQPPLYTIWWNIFHFESAAYLMNEILYYGGLIYISYVLSRAGKRWQNDLLVLFSLNPLLFTQLTIIWKDVSFTGLLIDCVAIYIFIKSLKNKKIIIGLWFIYFLLLFLAIGFRLNGVFAAYPLIVIGIYKLYYFKSKPQIKVLFTLLLGIIVSLVFIGINNIITNKIFVAKNVYYESYSMISDMAYIECESNYKFKIDQDIFIYHGNDVHDILCDKVINYYNDDALFGNWSGNPVILATAQTESQYDKIKTIWKYAIIHYPFDYLSYRSKFLTNDIFFEYWYPTGDLTTTQRLFKEVAMYQHYDMKFILPIFLVSATFACLFLCIYFQIYGLSFIVLSSSILQMFGYLFLIPAHPARYFYWDYIAAVLAIALLSFDFKSPDKINNFSEVNKYAKK